jgi:uncharacterized membrane protein YphA (DoxX/SURF4 family)
MMKIILAIIRHRYTHLACRLAIGAIFIYGSLDKIAHPALFAKTVYYYRSLPAWLVNIFSLCLPWVELVCGVLLVLGLYVRECALILILCFFSFTVGMGLAILRDIDIHCGCFSTTGGAKVSWLLIIRDLSLVLLPIQLLLVRANHYNLSSLLSRKNR